MLEAHAQGRRLRDDRGDWAASVEFLASDVARTLPASGSRDGVAGRRSEESDQGIGGRAVVKSGVDASAGGWLARLLVPAMVALAGCGGGEQPNARLAALPIDAGSVTVSGLSAGGYMAVQFHIAHSSLVHGAGVIAAGPISAQRTPCATRSADA